LTYKKSLEIAAEGESMSVNLSTGEIYNIEKDVKFQGELLPDFVLEIIENGGIKNRFKKLYGQHQ
jgi:3-isopropylmalate dehydratase small subunit